MEVEFCKLWYFRGKCHYGDKVHSTFFNYLHTYKCKFVHINRD